MPSTLPSTLRSAATGAAPTGEAPAKAFFEVDQEFSRFTAPQPPPSRLTCSYNPKDLRVSGGSTWSPAEGNQEHDVAPHQFVRPNPRTMAVQVLLDRYGTESGDVSADIETLFAWTRPYRSPTPAPDGQVSAPWLRFQWGSTRYFRCYLESVNVSVTLFSSEGLPLRATADLSLKELAEPLPLTNPTSGGAGGERRHRVEAGDSLHAIATAQYGNPRYWRGLAAFNDVDDPLRLRTGTSLAVPDVATVEALS